MYTVSMIPEDELRYNMLVRSYKDDGRMIMKGCV